MEKKSLSKKIEFESHVLKVCKKNEQLPFINAFKFEPPSAQEDYLGILVGIVQIFDYSESSAYLPNLISQVIKKEYYSNRKRSAEDSFESALHKVNLALTELAQHEVIQWLGKTHAVIAAIANDEIFFTQAGGGKILLIRDQKINEISRGLDDGEGDGHPIKTFSNVSSGKVIPNDKIIFANESAIDCLGWENLKRHAKAFNSSEFDNLISSTVELETDNSALITINIFESRPLVKKITPEQEKEANLKNNDEINFFGKKDDLKKEITENKKLATTPTINDNGNSLTPKVKQTKSIEDTVGTIKQEIYIKENEENDIPKVKISENKLLDLLKNILEKLSFLNLAFLKQKIGENLIFILKKIKKKEMNQVIFNQVKKTADFSKKKFTKILDSSKNIPSRIFNFSKNTAFKQNAFWRTKETLSPISKNDSEIKRIEAPKIQGRLEIAKNFFIAKNTTSLEKIKTFKDKLISNSDFLFKKKNLLGKKGTKIFFSLIGTITIIVALVVIKSFWQFIHKPINNNISTENQIGNQIMESTQSKIEYEIVEKLNSKVISTTILKDEIFSLTEDGNFFSLDLTNNDLKKIDLDNNIPKSKVLASMPPLQLIFIVSNQTVFSYSPVTKKFFPNNIAIPENSIISSADTYLTYLYLLAENKKEIYQFPRAQGGFGERKVWLKQPLDMENPKKIAISDSILIADKFGALEKYFSGKKENAFNFDHQFSDPQEIFIRPIPGTENSLILAQKEGKIYQINNQGKVEEEYFNPDFTNALGFDFYQKENAIYIFGEDGAIMKARLQ